MPLERLYDAIPKFLSRTPALLRTITFHPVQSLEELLEATRLVYGEYVKRGYVKPNPAQSKLSILHLLPGTTTIVARHHERGVIGTVTVIQDSPLGLPMDEAYKPELDLVRARAHVAEVSMLAFDRGVADSAKGLPTFQCRQFVLALHLFKCMFEYVRQCTSINELVACFNPRHEVLYEFLHLLPLGGRRPYSVVNGNPAVGRSLDLSRVAQLAQHSPVMRFFHAPAQPPNAFARRFMLTAGDLKTLRARCPSVFASASRSELAYLERCYRVSLTSRPARRAVVSLEAI